MKIHIGVGGRFHSDHMADALASENHQVVLHTTLPKGRFLVDPAVEIRSYPFTEVLYRLSAPFGVSDHADHLKMKTVGNRLAKVALREKVDALISWSSFGLEAFRLKAVPRQILMRDSSHIRYQTKLLSEEYARMGLKFKARNFCIERELEEYELADEILVLSDFAKKSFVSEGVVESKISTLQLGVDFSRFIRPDIRPKAALPIKVVFFGSLGIRKGTHILLEATKEFSEKQLELHLIGPVERGFQNVMARYQHAHFHGRMSQIELAHFVSQMDVFVFPTFEDGFGQTLLQAMAVGLFPITTTHCGASEAIIDGENGFIVPVGDVRALVEVLYQFTERPDQLDELRKRPLLSNDYHWDTYHDSINKILSTGSRPLAA